MCIRDSSRPPPWIRQWQYWTLLRHCCQKDNSVEARQQSFHLFRHCCWCGPSVNISTTASVWKRNIAGTSHRATNRVLDWIGVLDPCSLWLCKAEFSSCSSSVHSFINRVVRKFRINFITSEIDIPSCLGQTQLSRLLLLLLLLLLSLLKLLCWTITNILLGLTISE